MPTAHHRNEIPVSSPLPPFRSSRCVRFRCGDCSPQNRPTLPLDLIFYVSRDDPGGRPFYGLLRHKLLAHHNLLADQFTRGIVFDSQRAYFTHEQYHPTSALTLPTAGGLRNRDHRIQRTIVGRVVVLITR